MNNTLLTIHSLRSIHGEFSDRDVPESELDIIVNAAVQAANASARQSYSIIIVKDRKTIREQFDYPGSKALLFCVDFTRITATARHLGHQFDPGGIMGFITGSTDTILAAQTAAVAARSIGVDSLFTNSIHRHPLDEVYRFFNLPQKHCFPLITLILGYTENEPSCRKGRLNGSSVIHSEKYQYLDKTRLDNLVGQYDDPENHLGMTDAWRKMGFQHYLDWFYTKWFAGDSTEKQKELLSTLREACFIK